MTSKECLENALFCEFYASLASHMLKRLKGKQNSYLLQILNGSYHIQNENVCSTIRTKTPDFSIEVYSITNMKLF